MYTVQLEDILIYFNSKNAKTNIENCKNLMKNDYFMQDYIDIFVNKEKCKECSNKEYIKIILYYIPISLIQLLLFLITVLC